MKVNNRLTKFSKNLNLKVFPKNPSELYEPCDYFLNIGGKRLRPLLCYIGNLIFAPPKKGILNLAKALELFHNFTLMHDDLIDQSLIRRNRKTVHIKYDQNTAILSGDVMLINAYHLLEKIDEKSLPLIFKTLNKVAIQVCEGQQLDINFVNIPNVSVKDYMSMIQLKTAVLFGASLKMGSILANTTTYNIRNIYQFGLYLGLAFQIQDDFLDCYGTETDFGKEIGLDIKNNKKTILSCLFLEKSSKEQKENFINHYKNSKKVDVNYILSLFNQIDLKKDVQEIRNSLVKKALYHLNKITSYNNEYKIWLRELVTELNFRIK